MLRFRVDGLPQKSLTPRERKHGSSLFDSQGWGSTTRTRRVRVRVVCRPLRQATVGNRVGAYALPVPARVGKSTFGSGRTPEVINALGKPAGVAHWLDRFEAQLVEHHHGLLRCPPHHFAHVSPPLQPEPATVASPSNRFGNLVPRFNQLN